MGGIEREFEKREILKGDEADFFVDGMVKNIEARVFIIGYIRKISLKYNGYFYGRMWGADYCVVYTQKYNLKINGIVGGFFGRKLPLRAYKGGFAYGPFPQVIRSNGHP